MQELQQPAKVYDEGKWWYVWRGKRQSLESWEAQNKERMFVGGEYISRKHPLYKPGRYATFEDAWSHQELDKITKGHVYLITNPAWPEWVKLGMAVDASDRLKSFNTSSPFRDYEMAYSVEVSDKRKAEKAAHHICGMLCEERRGEWFKMPTDNAVEVLEQLKSLVTD